MRYKSLTFGLVTTVVLVLATLAFVAYNVNRFWTKPADVGIIAQRKLNEFFSNRNIDGYANVIFYYESVKVVGDNIKYDDVKSMEPILKGIYWLKTIDVTETSISNNDLLRLQEEFSPILVWNRHEPLFRFPLHGDGAPEMVLPGIEQGEVSLSSGPAIERKE